MAQALTALFGAVLLALLIACADLASLLVARGMARRAGLTLAGSRKAACTLSTIFASSGRWPLAIAPAMFDRVERGIELGYAPADIDAFFAEPVDVIVEALGGVDGLEPLHFDVDDVDLPRRVGADRARGPNSPMNSGPRPPEPIIEPAQAPRRTVVATSDEAVTDVVSARPGQLSYRSAVTGRARATVSTASRNASPTPFSLPYISAVSICR